MGIRLSGLTSGLDTESIVKELMSAQSYKKTRIENKRTKLEWKQEAWSELNKKIYKLYTDELSKFKTQGSYLTKSVTSTDSSKATFSASSNVPSGTHKIEINSVASSQFVTGSKLTGTIGTVSASNISTSTKLTDLGIAEGTEFNLTVGVANADHKNTESTFSVTASTKLSDLTNWAKKEGINLSYDTSNQRFFMSSIESGTESSFELSCTTSEASGATSNIKETVGFSYLTDTQKSEVNGALATLTTATVGSEDYLSANDTLQKYANAYNQALNGVESTIKASGSYKEAVESNFKTLMEGIDGVSLSFNESGECSIVTAGSVSSEDLAQYESWLSDAKEEAYSECFADEKGLVQNSISSYVTSYEAGTASGETVDITSAVSDYKQATMNSTKSALDTLGIGNITYDGTKIISSLESDGVKVVQSSDCNIVYNGASFNSSSNSIKINGLTINAIEVTKDTPLTVSVSNNKDAVYNMVKSFVSSYNSILKEVNDYYYADSAKGYDVLTDEEKEAMTEEQVEKWESKIKGSLLRRDSTLGTVMSALTSITSTSVNVDGKTYSLASFGIGTTDYTERGLLHINGDSEDSAVSDLTDSLMNAISNDPETVMTVLSDLGSQLYTNLQDKMKATSLSSSLTFYNDKQLSSLKKQYESEISKWETKLQDIEDRYYKKFSAMETAMSKLESSSSYISSLFSF